MRLQSINNTADSYRSIKGVVTLVLTLVAVLVFLPVLRTLFGLLTKVTDKVDGAVEQAAINTVDKKWSSYPEHERRNLERVAKAVHNAFHGSAFDEDEDTAIRELNSLKTRTQVQIVSDFYRVIAGNSLKTDANKFLFDGLGSIPVIGRLGNKFTESKLNKLVKDNWY